MLTCVMRYCSPPQSEASKDDNTAEKAQTEQPPPPPPLNVFDILNKNSKMYTSPI